MLPKMIRVRQSFPRPRVADITRRVAETLAASGHPIRRGDTVAVGAGSRGIANIGLVVGATVRYLLDLGARPFVFPAMGSHGGGTPDGQLSVLAISLKPSGISVTLSPWLIHTFSIPWPSGV